jgi:hypothetical protein
VTLQPAPWHVNFEHDHLLGRAPVAADDVQAGPSRLARGTGTNHGLIVPAFAAKIGRTVAGLRLKRKKLGIPNLIGRGEWKAEELALLGTLPDREVSRRTARTLSAIAQKRFALGIPVVKAGP